VRLRSRTQTDGGTAQLAVKVGRQMRSKQLAGCVEATSPVGGEMLASSTAGTCALVRCDVGCQTTLLPSGLSPTIIFLLVVADKLLIVASELVFRS